MTVTKLNYLNAKQKILVKYNSMTKTAVL